MASDEWEKRVRALAWSVHDIRHHGGTSAVTIADALSVAREAFEAGKREAFAKCIKAVRPTEEDQELYADGGLLDSEEEYELRDGLADQLGRLANE